MTARPAPKDTGQLGAVFWVGAIFLVFVFTGLFFEWLFPDAGPYGGLPITKLNLQFIGLAMHNYASAHNGHLPPAVVTDKAGRPLYSWRVLMLPLLEEEPLFKQFHLDEPWDSEHNKTLIEQIPTIYRHNYGGQHEKRGYTAYQVFVGPGTAFERPGLTWADFPYGNHRTFLVVEAAEEVPWTKPADLVYDPDGPLPKLGGWSSRPKVRFHRVVGEIPGYWACMGDGSCRFIPSNTDEATVRAWINRNSVDKVDVP